jgi:hypothetical protein
MLMESLISATPSTTRLRPKTPPASSCCSTTGRSRVGRTRSRMPLTTTMLITFECCSMPGRTEKRARCWCTPYVVAAARRWSGCSPSGARRSTDAAANVDTA